MIFDLIQLCTNPEFDIQRLDILSDILETIFHFSAIAKSVERICNKDVSLENTFKEVVLRTI